MSDDFLRDLVDGEREALVPDPRAKAKTWQRVSHSVAIGAPVAGFGASKAAASKLTLLSYGKGLAVLALTSIAAVGTYAAVADRDAAPTSTTAAPVAAEPSSPSSSKPTGRGWVAAPPEDVEAPAEVAESDAVAVPVVEPSEPRTEPPAARRAATPAAASPPATAGASALAEETRLLADARRKLRSGQARAALTVLADHATRFAQGQLREDRMALLARALCRAGDRDEGLREAAKLREAFPASSHHDRVTLDCGDPATP
jgi:hypothetical protein